jgi:hypothetical protein
MLRHLSNGHSEMGVETVEAHFFFIKGQACFSTIALEEPDFRRLQPDILLDYRAKLFRLEEPGND